MENKEMQVALASVMKDPAQRRALSEIMVEYINPNHITVDFIGMLLNTRNLKPGDILAKKVRKGIRVWSHIPGSIPLRSEITVSERANYIIDTSVVGLTASEWELESGELGTIASMKAEALAKVRDYFLNRVFVAMSTVWTAANTPNNYTSVGGALNSTALKNAIDYVNTTTSGAKAIVGTRSALTPITTFGASWSDGTANMEVPENISEVMRTGWLGRYYGVPVIALSQSHDNPEDYNELLPKDKIIILGENVGEFVTFGDNRATEYTDPRPMPPQWNWQMMFQWGLIIDNAQGIYVIDDLT